MAQIKELATTIQPRPSWIEEYVEYTEDTPAPLIYRQWVAIATIGLALERRVWTYVRQQCTFPNLFVFLVGKPGVGKSVAIDPMSSIIRETALFNLLPQDLTSSSLLDRLADEKFRKRIQLPSGDYLEYHTAGMYTS